MRLTATLLRNRQIKGINHADEDEIVDEGIDDEAVENPRPNVVVVGRGPTKLLVGHLVASGDAQHRILFDACKRARGIGGTHERRELGREDKAPLVAIDWYRR